MNQILPLIGRDKALLLQDINNNSAELSHIVSQSRFLVLGGAGSISTSSYKRNIQA